jgi:hypothetical protein
MRSLIRGSIVLTLLLGGTVATAQTYTSHVFSLIKPVQTKRVHSFVDAPNVMLWAGNAAVQWADYRSTEQGLRRGAVEMNGLGQSRGSRIALKTAGTFVPVLLAYACHRAGHHRLERLMPVIYAVPSGIAFGYNKRF